jgi:hypothetical protein
LIHPNDRTLERYRSRNLTLEELRKVDRHISECGVCVSRLGALAALEARLREIPMEEPSAGFTGRILEELRMEDSRAADLKSATPGQQLKARPEPRPRFSLRPELANAMIATAATYVFVSSGFVGVVFSVDRGGVEYQLYMKVQAVLDWVGQLSQALY